MEQEAVRLKFKVIEATSNRDESCAKALENKLRKFVQSEKPKKILLMSQNSHTIHTDQRSILYTILTIHFE